MKKRREPDPVPALTLGRIRYEVPIFGAPLGVAQDGGILAACDAACGSLIWAIRLWVQAEDPEMEEDKRDAFASALRALPDGRLEIESDAGDRILVDPRAPWPPARA